ncbi:MAG: tellurite resistance TerB family protein [Marinibacterium sp.]
MDRTGELFQHCAPGGNDMSVLARLINAFRAAEPEPLPEPDAQLALGALMVQIALSDRKYQVEEISLIDRVLAEMFDLGPIEAARMRATCEKLFAAAPATETFAALIRAELDSAARGDAMRALWQVVLADGMVEDSELAIIDEARLALGLTVAETAAARGAAEAALVNR